MMSNFSHLNSLVLNVGGVHQCSVPLVVLFVIGVAMEMVNGLVE